MHGKVVRVRHQAIHSKKDSRFAVALDSDRNTIMVRDMIKVYTSFLVWGFFTFGLSDIVGIASARICGRDFLGEKKTGVVRLSERIYPQKMTSENEKFPSRVKGLGKK